MYTVRSETDDNRDAIVVGFDSEKAAREWVDFLTDDDDSIYHHTITTNDGNSLVALIPINRGY